MATEAPITQPSTFSKYVNFNSFLKLGESAKQTLLALIALVCTVASAAIVCVFKAITFFIPKGHLIQVDRFLGFIASFPVAGTRYTALFACAIAAPFREPAKHQETLKVVNQFFLNEKEHFKDSINNVIDKFAFAHINGSN